MHIWQIIGFPYIICKIVQVPEPPVNLPAKDRDMVCRQKVHEEASLLTLLASRLPNMWVFARMSIPFTRPNQLYAMSLKTPSEGTAQCLSTLSGIYACISRYASIGTVSRGFFGTLL